MVKLKVDERSRLAPWLILILLICIGLIPRIIDTINASGIELDGAFYANAGEHISRGEFRDALKGVFPPFYPFLIGLAHLFIDDLEFAGRIASIIIGILLIPLCYFAVKKIYGIRHGLYMAFFVAVHPYLVRFSAQVLSESTAIFIFTLSVFLFYWGWTEERLYLIGLSGICLGLAYLTRPEYIVYPVPLSLILLFKKRFKGLIVFILCFFVVALPYILYLKYDTGLWVISKKAILAKQQKTEGLSVHSYLFPVLSFFNTLKNIPSVIYHFFEAVFPPFIILCFLGIKGTTKRFAMMAVLLFLFHVISISLMTSSTRRFSVGFIPIVLVFCVSGIVRIGDYLARFRKNRVFFWIVIFIIFASSIYQGIISQNPGRILNKKAGLFMKTYDSGKKIASRMPLVSFYSRSEWVNIVEEIKIAKDCRGLVDTLKKLGVRYIVIDEVLEAYAKEKGIDITEGDCLKDTTCVITFNNKDEFVRILRLPDV
ncbi:MAG: glycosyltransferase family 39 protein [Syntrophorhabdales bacterium]|nr:glycosyltransferase family 39 protein [Syntrophorhabdales bacterium]